jgi:SAM-dependent methyltransferase
LLLFPPSRGTVYVGIDLPVNCYGSPDLEWDGRKIPFGDATVDSVLVTEFLEHCSRPDEVLTEIARVLKPNGYLFLTVPSTQCLTTSIATRLSRYADCGRISHCQNRGHRWSPRSASVNIRLMGATAAACVVSAYSGARCSVADPVASDLASFEIGPAS